MLSLGCQYNVNLSDSRCNSYGQSVCLGQLRRGGEVKVKPSLHNSLSSVAEQIIALRNLKVLEYLLTCVPT